MVADVQGQEVDGLDAKSQSAAAAAAATASAQAAINFRRYFIFVWICAVGLLATRCVTLRAEIRRGGVAFFLLVFCARFCATQQTMMLD